MLKNKAIKSAHAAARYVEETDDYYGKEPGAKGEWLGKGAAALGLKGATHAAQLLALLQGRLPNGEQISQSFGKSAQRRAGWDFTFSPPIRR